MIMFGLIITVLAAFMALKISRDTQGVCYFSPSVSTDNEKIVRSADQVQLLDWPSKMHSIPLNRSQLREYWTLFIHILGRFKKDKFSDHMNITLALIANGVSSVLIYFVFSNYFSPTVGFVTSLLYITSFWPYHVAIFMGHIHLAQMFFLLAVLCLQAAESFQVPISYLIYLSGGVLTAVSFFSSSASRKYPVLMFIALIYSLRGQITTPWTYEYSRSNIYWITGITIVTLIVNITIRTTSKKILLLLKKTTEKNWGKEHIIAIRGMLTKLLILVVLFYIFFDVSNKLFFPLVSFILGAVIVGFHILLPQKDMMSNIARYYTWLNVSTWASHFNAYHDPVKAFGRIIPENFRGGGLIWVHRLFLRFMPFVYPLYWLSIFYLVY